jgi:amidase
MPISFQLMASDGPMARNVADVRLGLKVLAGHHPRDPNSVNAQFTTVDRPLKIAVMAEPPGGTVDPRIADLTRDAGRALEAAGCTVEEASPPDMEDLVELWFRLIANDLSLAFADLQQVMSEDAARGVEDILRDRAAADAASYAEALMLRHSAARAWAAFFSDYDLLLSPTWTALPFRTGWDLETSGRMTETLRQARCVMPGNVLGLPSASVPAGLVNGLPVGVLLTGSRFSDHLCLDAAEMVERALGVATPIDPR